MSSTVQTADLTVTVTDPYDPMGMPIYDGDVADARDALVDGSYEAAAYDAEGSLVAVGQLVVRAGKSTFAALEG